MGLRGSPSARPHVPEPVRRYDGEGLTGLFKVSLGACKWGSRERVRACPVEAVRGWGTGGAAVV